MKIRPLLLLSSLAISISACDSGDQNAPASQSAPSIAPATANSIVLDSGRKIVVPEGVDVLRSGWTYSSFTATEAAEILSACGREERRLLKEGKSPDLQKPLLWVCRQAAAGAENFKQ
ncbi:hypothetical protein [Stenotrophomonas maltophilia]|uniref:hypothetical protein n=1 Tax=Stenotrophomonas maltophilia TaxID=40324 RepID=UPI0021C6B82C|nr:hypothetical protein [Stenotrophomonas maltophilia]MCU1142253.1 hypothetical protein [Stenotrophomonas maltophilia]